MSTSKLAFDLSGKSEFIFPLTGADHQLVKWWLDHDPQLIHDIPIGMKKIYLEFQMIKIQKHFSNQIQMRY